MPAKQTVVVKRVKTKSRTKQKKSNEKGNKRGTNKRCPGCGRFV